MPDIVGKKGNIVSRASKPPCRSWDGRLVLAIMSLLAQPAAVSAAGFSPVATAKFLEQRAARACEGRIAADWSTDGFNLIFIDPNSGDLMRSNLTTGTRRKIASAERLKRLVIKATRKSTANIGALKDLRVSKGGAVLFSTDDQFWSWHPASGLLSPRSRAQIDQESLSVPRPVRSWFPMVGEALSEEKSPDGSLFLSAMPDGQMGLRSSNSDVIDPITNDGGIDSFYFNAAEDNPSLKSWSPNSSMAVLIRRDMRQLRGEPIVDWIKRPVEIERFGFFGDGVGKSLPIDLFTVYNILTKVSVPIKIPPSAEHHLKFAGWLINGQAREVVILRLTRDHLHAELVAADAATGTTRTLLRDDRSDGPVFMTENSITRFASLPDGRFVWMSDIDGESALFLHDTQGRKLRRVTPVGMVATAITEIDGKSGNIYFHAHGDAKRPYDVQFYRAPIDGSGIERLTSGIGQNSATLSPDFKSFLNVSEDLGRPARTEARLVAGGPTVILAEGNAALDLADGWSAPEPFVTTGADGVTQIHGIVMKPRHFDPSRHYPVIERIYGGMQATAVPRSYLGLSCGGPFSNYDNMLAHFQDNGFAVVVMDAPGTPGRTRAFQMRPWGKWPTGIVSDHVAALRNLAKEKPWLDLDRLGIDGNSYGGYMAIRAAIEFPGFYKAVAASVPSVDPLGANYWDELLLGGSPAARAQAYADADLLTKVDRITDPLLIVSGTADANVPISHTMRLLDALAVAGKPYDLVLFPGTNHDHGLADGGTRYPYAVTKITSFFQDKLAAGMALKQ